MIFSLSALVAFYKGNALENDTIKNIRKHDGSEYDIIDTPKVLNWIHTLWQEYKEPNENECCDLMNKILSAQEVWDEDLNSITELAEKSGHYLHLILNKGIEKAIEESKLL